MTVSRKKDSTNLKYFEIKPQDIGYLFVFLALKFYFKGVFLKARSHDPFLRIRFLLVPNNGSCEHNKNDLPSNGSVSLKKRMEIEHALFSSDTLLERWKALTNFAWSFWRQIEDSLLVLKNGSCEHTANDLLTFSPQKRNLEIGPSERLLPVFGTKNRILKNGSCERALSAERNDVLHFHYLIIIIQW